MSKKIITNKQKIIQILIYTFRFLNSKQVQVFLNHKDHRRINSWLKDLNDKQYLERDFKPVYGILTKPAVYFLSPKGRQYIRETYPLASKKYLGRLRDDKERSKGFRIRWQTITDCYLILFEDYVAEFPQTLEEWLTKGIKLKANEFHFFTPAFYASLDFVLLPLLKPDAYCYIKRKEGITHTMLYVLDAYIPRMILNYSLKNIFTKLDEESWEDETISSLQFYFVCPNNMIIVYLKRLLPSFLERYYGSNELLFHFATRNQMYKQKDGSAETIDWVTLSSKNY